MGLDVNCKIWHKSNMCDFGRVRIVSRNFQRYVADAVFWIGRELMLCGTGYMRTDF